MASILKVDEMQGVTSAGDITITGEGTATMRLQQGLAKAWYIFDGTAGTPAFADSFNCSSLTDVATGRQAPNWTNSMRAANEYSHSTNATNLSALYSPGTTTTSKSERFNTNDSGTLQDRTLSCGSTFGDLA